MLTTIETSPGPLLDWFHAKKGYSSEQSKEPKAGNPHNNLLRPVQRIGRTEGSFKGRRFSLYTWLRLLPIVTLAAGTSLRILGLARTLFKGERQKVHGT